MKAPFRSNMTYPKQRTELAVIFLFVGIHVFSHSATALEARSEEVVHGWRTFSLVESGLPDDHEGSSDDSGITANPSEFPLLPNIGSDNTLFSRLEGAAGWLQLKCQGQGNALIAMNAQQTISFTTRFVFATVVAFVASCLANAGGVGGGALFVPMFTLMLGYDPKTSAALSKGMIFGGAVASSIFNIQLRSPTQAHRPLIDYNLAVLLQPTLLLGISIGVTLNVVMPPGLVLVLLCALLFIMTYKTLKTGFKTWKLETLYSEEVATFEADPQSNEEHLDNDRSHHSETSTMQHSTGSGNLKRRLSFPIYDAPEELGMHIVEPGREEDEEEGDPDTLKRQMSLLKRLEMGQPIEEPLYKMIMWKNVGVLFVLWIGYATVQILKEKYAPRCGMFYWVLSFSQVPMSLGVAYWGATKFTAEHNADVIAARLLHVDHGEEELWTLKDVMVYPFWSLLSGTMGGTLGIGGALILGPVLLELGMHPQVTAATSIFIIVYSASMSVIEFYLVGRIPIDIALFFSTLSIFGSLIGLSILRAVVVWSGKASIVIFLLAFVIGLSGAIMLSLAVVDITGKGFDVSDYTTFSPLCGQ